MIEYTCMYLSDIMWYDYWLIDWLIQLDWSIPNRNDSEKVMNSDWTVIEHIDRHLIIADRKYCSYLNSRNHRNLTFSIFDPSLTLIGNAKKARTNQNHQKVVLTLIFPPIKTIVQSIACSESPEGSKELGIFQEFRARIPGFSVSGYCHFHYFHSILRFHFTVVSQVVSKVFSISILHFHILIFLELDAFPCFWIGDIASGVLSGAQFSMFRDSSKFPKTSFDPIISSTINCLFAHQSMTDEHCLI